MRRNIMERKMGMVMEWCVERGMGQWLWNGECTPAPRHRVIVMVLWLSGYSSP